MDVKLVLRKILWEMLSKRRDLIYHAAPLYDEFSPWSLDKLWKVFEAIMTDPSANDIIIFVDGLDESSESTRDRFLSRVTSLFNGLTVLPRRTINFVLSSRPGAVDQRPEMRDLSTNLKLEDDSSSRKSIHADIQIYVETILARLYSNYGQGKGKTSSLAASIAARSEGSFLWATLVMERVQREFDGNEKILKQILAQCPPKLEGIYYKALRETEFHRAKIRKSFGILLTAKRPLTLDEFSFALAVEAHHHTLESLEGAHSEESGFLSYIHNHLGIFIKIDAGTITYRHESVKDFIFNKLRILEGQQPEEYNSRVDAWLDLSEEKAEWITANCCISFLKLDIFAGPRSSVEIDAERWEVSGLATMRLNSEPETPTTETLKTSGTSASDRDTEIFRIPFYGYAALNWGYH